jgi:hypothetical protein
MLLLYVNGRVLEDKNRRSGPYGLTSHEVGVKELFIVVVPHFTPYLVGPLDDAHTGVNTEEKAKDDPAGRILGSDLDSPPTGCLALAYPERY